MRGLAWTLILVTMGSAIRMNAAEMKSAVSFRNLSVEAALAAAKAEGKVVLIDFYTTWCEPCKRLDADTWSDAAVGKLVDEKAVALRLDAEKEGLESARKFTVNAYPTMLILKPDGTVIDRLVGYRPAADFKRDFAAALEGKPSLARARDAVSAAGGDVTHEQVVARQKLARELALAGRNEEALAEYVWLFDVGMKQVPSFAGVRLSFLTGEMGRLAKVYPPAADALRQRRDDAKVQMEADPSDRNAVRETSALNDALEEKGANLAIFESLPKGDPRRRGLGIRLFDEFVTARRYADALEIQDYAAMSRLLELELRPRPTSLPAELQARSRQMMFRRIAKYVEVLAGAGELDHARELAQQLLSADDSDEMKSYLRECAQRAGHPEVVEPAP